MKKLLLACLMAPLLAHAAQWSEVGSDNFSKSYIDKSSIMKSDAGQKAWSLVSYGAEQATQDGVPYRSMKALHVYSCKDRTTTLLSHVYYTEAMGKGPVAQSFKYEKFLPEDVIPDSTAEGALQTICKPGKKPKK
jgi:hypothetical protein